MLRQNEGLSHRPSVNLVTKVQMNDVDNDERNRWEKKRKHRHWYNRLFSQRFYDPVAVKNRTKRDNASLFDNRKESMKQSAMLTLHVWPFCVCLLRQIQKYLKRKIGETDAILHCCCCVFVFSRARWTRVKSRLLTNTIKRNQKKKKLLRNWMLTWLPTLFNQKRIKQSEFKNEMHFHTFFFSFFWIQWRFEELHSITRHYIDRHLFVYVCFVCDVFHSSQHSAIVSSIFDH